MAKSNSVSAMALQLQKLSNEATEKSFQYNAQEANTARNWQKMMSDTSHQREVADLKAAGLNPILSSGGSGAQSYTTSSASAQAENAASAVGGLFQAKMNSDATRAAAAQSAAATRHAAATAAAAQRYAAAMNYQASVYHSNRAYDAQKYKVDKDYDLGVKKLANQLASNPVELLDKIFNKTGATEFMTSTIRNQAKQFVKDLKNNPTAYIKPKDPNQKFGIGNYKLQAAGITQVDRQLKAVHLEPNNKNRKIWIEAIGFGNASSQIALQSMIMAAKSSYQSRLRNIKNRT